MGQGVDLYIVYEFIKRLSTPFNETDAFKLGLIDEKGKRLKYAKTKEEKDAMTLFDRMIFNLKRLMSKVPGGDSKLASYGAALLLMREEPERLEKMSDEELMESLLSEMKYIKKNSGKSFKDIREDAPANATGAAVAGTGDSGVHWVKNKYRVGASGERRKYGRQISGTAFLRRRMKRMANTDLRTS